MKKLRFLLLILFTVFTLVACGQNTQQDINSDSTSNTNNGEAALEDGLTAEQRLFMEENGYLPVFEPTECRGLVPSGFEAECGDLTVPEDRRDPAGSQVSMHVVIFKSRSENPLPDPLIYLTGGGGGNELDNTISYLDDGMDAILNERDFIMYNQRGAKYSTPYLACPGEAAMMAEAAGGAMTNEESDALVVDFYSACREALTDQGINLEMYNTVVNAVDFNDLRIALGYDQVNIYGTSYGSGLALAILRSYGEHIRSAIIDSVYPPQGLFYSQYATNADYVFQRLFAACQADSNCSQRYPDLETVMYQVTDELNANPRSFSDGMDGPRYTYDGDDFLNALYMFPYISRPDIMPIAIFQANRGNFSYIDNMMPYVLGTVESDTISAGVQWSILCREESAPEALDLMHELNDQLAPQLASAFDFSIYFEICQNWGVPLAEAWENSAVVSDVPTLVFAGEFDPITPVEWAEEAAETLSNHYLYVMPNWGHGIMRSVPCGLEIGLQFLADPTTEPDATCIDEQGELIFD